MIGISLNSNIITSKKLLVILSLYSSVNSYKLPGSCDPGKFYDPSLMDCLSCPVNASLVTSNDGWSCVCAEHSVPVGVSRCRPCGATQLVSADGLSCVPRHCQGAAGRVACRKCPADYISVTQNFDGSPMKEVQCIKCARGYRALNDQCGKCEACSCSKHEVVVKGRCVPKKYILSRAKYVEHQLHPDELLEIVKLEYLCTQHDYKACRSLASACVRNFYTSDPAGPCRLWLQDHLKKFDGIPILTIDALNKRPGVTLDRVQDVFRVIMTIHTKSGGLKILSSLSENLISCLPPVEIKIGYDFSRDCTLNVTKLRGTNFEDIFELYISSQKSLQPLPIVIRKPNGYSIQKNKWSSQHFRKFFLLNRFLSTTTNTTNIVYLRTLYLRTRVQRNTTLPGSLQVNLTAACHYDIKSPLTDIVTVSLRVEHELPSAGILRGLQICGGVFGSIMILYAFLQWRSVVKRGGLFIALAPLLSSSVADALYFATLFSCVHALAAEAGSLSLTLPLTVSEEEVIEAMVYSVVCLKALKVLWVNWNQCRCDIFFVDWSKYNPPPQDTIQSKSNNWKEALLATEWDSIQTRRRVSPGFTATSTLLILHFSQAWQSQLPAGAGYGWAVASAAWCCSHAALRCARRLAGPGDAARLTALCARLRLSLLVFQEDCYAHYVDGRNEERMDFRPTPSLQTCRVICSTQLRNVYKKLANDGYRGDLVSNRTLLSQFLAAFFERALDGLNWVASERTLFEKLLKVELVAREGGNTSILLYDGDDASYSFLDVTWWGEEWTLATFDAMLFGCVVMITKNPVLSALITLITWQALKAVRNGFGSYNVRNKIGLKN